MVRRSGGAVGRRLRGTGVHYRGAHKAVSCYHISGRNLCSEHTHVPEQVPFFPPPVKSGHDVLKGGNLYSLHKHAVSATKKYLKEIHLSWWPLIKSYDLIEDIALK